MVGVAQLVEHLVVVQDVAGSSPVTHPTRTVRLVRAVCICRANPEQVPVNTSLPSRREQTQARSD